MSRPLAALVLLFLIVTGMGCTQAATIAPVAEAKTLTVACCEETTYDYWYRDYLEAGFPDWTIKMVPMYNNKDYKPYTAKSLNAFVEREKPDLMILNVFDYKLLAEGSKLQNLGDWAGRTKLDLKSSLNPGVLDYLSDHGENELYGLANSFHANALYYNKDLFDRLGIPYPTDGMNWQETLALADRFMQDPRMDKKASGLYVPWLNGPFDLMQRIAGTEGLSYANQKTGEVTINTPGWNRIFKQVTAAYARGTFKMSKPKGETRDGVVYYDEQSLASADLFSQGLAALTVDDSNLMLNLKDSTKTKFAWGAVTPPASEATPERAGEISAYYLFGIPTASGQAKEAWQVISYMLSERVGKAKAGLGTLGGWDLSVWQNYPAWKQDKDYETFYKKLPTNTLTAGSYLYQQGPADFDEGFAAIADKHIRQALDGKETVDQAISAVQQEGETLMKTKLAEQQAKSQTPSADEDPQGATSSE